MASNPICKRCMLFLRRQVCYTSTHHRPIEARKTTIQRPSIRLLSSTSHHVSPILERPTSPSPTPTSGPKPSSTPPSQNLDFIPPPNAPTSLKIAQEVRKRAVGVTETYIAYGATQKLYRECASQADYTIPQASEKDGEIPKTSTGIDRGVGEGWWYKGIK